MAITLPHPHGSASGQIAHNAQYAVDDTPGSTGGRFVGFGEAGTSRVANRAAWALSENIDRIFTDVLSMPIAINAALSFTGTGVSRVQILGASVFCGDTNYPGTASPADPEGMHALFSVLDSQYNILTDGDNEVRAYSVYDSADATLVYKTGYVTSPWVHFCTVDPVTGAIVNPAYLIPIGVAVRLIYGVEATLKDLPYDHPDAFTRFRSLTGEDVPAGVVLQDGTRPMTGNLDFGGNDITGLDYIEKNSTTGILGIKSRIIMRPNSQARPSFSFQHDTLGSEGYGTFGTMEFLLGDRVSTGASVLMTATPSSADAKPAMVLSVGATGYASAAIVFSAFLNSFYPFTGAIDLGRYGYGWGNCYFTTLYSPNELDPITLGVPLRSLNDGTPIWLNGALSMTRAEGSAPNVYMEYLPSGTEPAGSNVLGMFSMSTWDATVQAIMSLSGDPNSPGTASSVLSWTVVNDVHGTVGMTLSSSPSYKSLTPMSHLGLGLGTFGTWWGACFLEQVRSSSVTLDNSRSVHLNDGADLVLLGRGSDFNFFSDFGNRLISASLPSVDPNPWIDENFILVGSVDSTFSSAGESLFGRTTVMSLETSTDPDAVALISGPILNRLTYNRISMTTCFALQFLPDVDGNPSYLFSMGLGSNTNIELSSTLFRVAMAHESRLLWLSWDDGQGHSGGTSTAQVLSAETYYTLEMRHGSDDLMRVYLNGSNILVGVPGFPGDDPGVLFTPGTGDFYSCPACITSLSSGTNIPVIIDWIDIHSEGHAR